jgi:hypothetical protein
MTSSLFVPVYAQTSTQQPAGDGVSILLVLLRLILRLGPLT